MNEPPATTGFVFGSSEPEKLKYMRAHNFVIQEASSSATNDGGAIVLNNELPLGKGYHCACVRVCAFVCACVRVRVCGNPRFLMYADVRNSCENIRGRSCGIQTQ